MKTIFALVVVAVLMLGAVVDAEDFDTWQVRPLSIMILLMETATFLYCMFVHPTSLATGS
jgi:hypothetical protein